MKRSAVTDMSRQSKKQNQDESEPSELKVEYHTPEDTKCGFPEKQDWKGIFTMDGTYDALKSFGNTDLDLVHLVLRAVYYFNKDSFTSKLCLKELIKSPEPAIPINWDAEESTYEKKKCADEDMFVLHDGEGFTFIAKNYSEENPIFVAGVSRLIKCKSTSLLQTKIYDSAYSITPSLPLDIGDNPKRYDPLAQKMYFTSFMRDNVMPRLNLSLSDVHGLVENEVSVESSVLYQCNPDDASDGISSILCILLALVGKKPCDIAHMLHTSFAHFNDYKRKMILLFLAAIGKYLKTIDAQYIYREYVNANDDEIWPSGPIADEDQFDFYFSKIQLEYQESSFDYKGAIGPELFSLFQFVSGTDEE